MKYQVPLYRLKKEEKIIGKIVVEKTSLGVFEVASGKRIRVTTGYLEINSNSFQNSVYVKSSDFNGRHLIAPTKIINEVHKKQQKRRRK